MYIEVTSFYTDASGNDCEVKRVSDPLPLTDDDLMGILDFSDFEDEGGVCVDHSGEPGVVYNLDLPDSLDTQEEAEKAAQEVLDHALKLVRDHLA